MTDFDIANHARMARGVAGSMPKGSQAQVELLAIADVLDRAAAMQAGAVWKRIAGMQSLSGAALSRELGELKRELIAFAVSAVVRAP